MKKKNIVIISISVFVLIAAVLLTGIFGFGWFRSEIKNIKMTVIYADETNDVFKITTNAETLREALEEQKLVEGEESEYGLFITAVNGVTADEEKEEWWCLTKGGEEMQTGIDDTYISDGDAYELTLTTGYFTEEENPNAAFFEKYVDTDARNYAVMIDNDNEDARPQAGLDEAYLVYEIVVEGGATRYMALFRNDTVEKIGPVRSSRHYFLDYALENDAVYTHFGWSPKAQSDIPALGVNNINGIYDGSTFARDYAVTKDWHTAYTSMASIKETAAAKGYSEVTESENVFTYNEEDTDIANGTLANDISLRYNGIYTTGYKYNAETKTYTKQLNGADYMAQSGNPVTAKNIIIQFASNYNLGDGSARQNVETVGSSTGYYITNGQCIKINWSKSERAGKTTYTDESGAEITLNPGKTFVNIISPSIGATIQ